MVAVAVLSAVSVALWGLWPGGHDPDAAAGHAPAADADASFEVPGTADPVVFTDPDGAEVHLGAFGGCVATGPGEADGGGVEYRLEAAYENTQVGVVVLRRESGYLEVSVVKRDSVTDIGQVWSFNSDVDAANAAEVALDGSGFAVDVPLVGSDGSEASLVGDAECTATP